MTNSFGLTKVQRVIAISSCKGGVGKSTIAAALAVAMNKRGLRVGLLDADIHGPSIPSLFAMHQAHIKINEFKMAEPVLKDGLKLMSFGFLLGDAPAVMRGPMLANYLQQLLFQTNWGELDYLLIDMPPGTGDVQLTITQSVRLTGAVIVTTAQMLSLVDVARGILMFEKVRVPILGIVENMAYFICDQCSKKHFPFGQEKLLEQRFGVPVLLQIPIVAGGEIAGFMDQAVDGMIQAIERMSDSQNQIPDVSFDEQYIRLKFKDGRQWQLSNRAVRLSCQCAICVNEITGRKILNPDNIKINIAPKQIIPLGNYAIGITWNDGHSSGIYSYQNLEKLIQQQ